MNLIEHDQFSPPTPAAGACQPTDTAATAGEAQASLVEITDKDARFYRARNDLADIGIRLWRSDPADGPQRYFLGDGWWMRRYRTLTAAVDAGKDRRRKVAAE